MVPPKKKSSSSSITELFGTQTQWFDIQGSAEEKWCPNEGNHVSDMILRACEFNSGDPSIFIITPLEMLLTECVNGCKWKKAGYANDIDNRVWINNNIGTVHTFREKRLRQLFFCGAPSSVQMLQGGRHQM